MNTENVACEIVESVIDKLNILYGDCNVWSNFWDDDMEKMTNELVDAVKSILDENN